jgi:predicted phage gp36 major capsid-like protein
VLRPSRDPHLEYLIYDRLGTVLAYEPIVKGANQRPTGQAGWLMFSRVGADVLNPNAFAVLQL